MAEGIAEERARDLPRRGRERLRLPPPLPTDEGHRPPAAGAVLRPLHDDAAVRAWREAAGLPLQPLRGHRRHSLLPRRSTQPRQGGIPILGPIPVT